MFIVTEYAALKTTVILVTNIQKDAYIIEKTMCSHILIFLKNIFRNRENLQKSKKKKKQIWFQ